MASLSQPDSVLEQPMIPLLPWEVVENIVRQTDNSSTLTTLMRVSRKIHDVAGARLYGDIVMTAKNAKGIFRGLQPETDFLADVQGTVKDGKRKFDLVSNKIPARIASLVAYDSDSDSDSDLDEDESSPHMPTSTFVPRKTKAELLSMVKHLHVHEIPPWETCFDILELVSRVTHPTSSQPRIALTVSIRPKAAWHLIRSYTYAREQRRQIHPFLRYLRSIPVQHMCIQLPIMDRHVEDTYMSETAARRPSRSIRGKPTCYVRDRLRDAILDSPTTDDVTEDVHGFFNMIVPGCETVTIHNTVLGMSERALALLGPNIKMVRAFFRPCAGADGELVTKTRSGYCYNHHKGGDMGPGGGGFKLKQKVLRSPQDMELIDIDWVRGKYQPDRDDKSLRSMEQQLEAQVENIPEDERVGWGSKKMKMSNEVEMCQCCTRGQLSAVESSIAYGIVD